MGKRLFFVVVLVLIGSNCWAQGHCMSFSGTMHLGLRLDLSTGIPIGWVGTATVTFGKGTSEIADVAITTTGNKKGIPGTDDKVTMGTETATFSFQDGGFQILSHFVTEHSDQELAWVNESGTIIPLDKVGRFANASGRYTFHGPFGLAIAPPGVTPPPGFLDILGCIGEIHGTICSID